MKHSLPMRTLALCLCLCLMPVLAFAYNGDDSPVTRSDFRFWIEVEPDAFPNDGAAHYADIASFLEKISLRGVADTQHFFEPLNRIYFEGGFTLKDELVLPFVFDSYITYRYIRSQAIGGASLHFQMLNFFQFMLKAYYYMGLPTQLIAVPLYPEAAVDLYRAYESKIGDTFAGDGDREISYDELYDLCLSLDEIIQEDPNDRAYYFFTSLLIDLGASDRVLDWLCYLEDWLNKMDPDMLGLTITTDEKGETWTLGENVVYERNEDSRSIMLTDPEEYVYALTVEERGDCANVSLIVTSEEEVCFSLQLELAGIPQDESGTFDLWAQIDVSGSDLTKEIPTQTLHLASERSADVLPYDWQLKLEWLHLETGEPAIRLCYDGHHEEQSPDVLIERTYDNQDDAFHLNEGLMEEYKERFLPTLALSAVPFLLEMPSGVYSDIVAFMDATGFLTFFGVE